MIKELLYKKGIKATNQRIEILEIIKNNNEISIKNLCKKLSHIDRSTIYRTIDLFLDKNVINKVLINKEIFYEIKEEHKHYLKCVKCHKRIVINNCPFDCEQIEGFKVLNHSINIDGICDNCQNC